MYRTTLKHKTTRLVGIKITNLKFSFSYKLIKVFAKKRSQKLKLILFIDSPLTPLYTLN